MSHLNKIYNPYLAIKSKPQLYYGAALFYIKLPSSSNWGFRASLDFNTRGAKGLYEGDWNDGLYGQSYIVSESFTFFYSASLSFAPTLSINKKLMFFVGPNFNVSVFGTDKYRTTYYKTSAKEDILEVFTDKDPYYFQSFSYRLSYGGKVGLNYKFSNEIDFGIAYQYARPVKKSDFGPTPYFNILHVSILLYFKLREEEQ